MGTGAAVMGLALAIIVIALPPLSSANSCVSEILSPSSNNDGYITSPGYPEQYSADLCMIWVYTGRPGMQITIRLLDIDIPSYYFGNCSGDFLKIGPVAEQKYCGNSYRKSFQPYTAQMTESLCTLKIIFFTSRSGVQGKGFRLYYQFVDVSLTNTTEPSIDSTVPTQNPVYPPDQCNFVLSNSSGQITSDYLYSTIEKSGVCTWLLHSDLAEGQQVRFELTFDRLRLSPDSIFNVYDGASTSAEVIWRLTVDRPSVLKSSQNSMFIYYNPGQNLYSVGLTELFTIKYTKNVTCAGRYLLCGYGEQACYRQYNHCDGVWHCPLHGGDERGCFGDCRSNFSCGPNGMGCYSENERCNGRGVCPDNIDEQNCNAKHCSSTKGLFLCSNLRCINNTLRCDGNNNCLDDSDEVGCYSSPTLIVLVAVVSTMIFALLFVITIGCACQCYRQRARRRHGPPRHESPLSRQLSEMLSHRAPPPPYHEAMLTSRPYNEAYSELLSQTQRQSESLGIVNNGYQENDGTDTSQQQSNGLQSSRGSWNNLLPIAHNGNQNPFSRSRTEIDRLLEEGVENCLQQEATSGADATGDRDLPPYRETDSSLLTRLYPEDSWFGSFENVVSTDNDNFHVNSDGQPLIQMDMISSNSVLDQASTFSTLISSSRVRSLPSLHDEDGSNKDALSANTSLSIGSPRLELVEEKDEDEDTVQEDVDIIDDDSDSDCILAINEAYDEDDDDDDGSNDSDTACILNQE